MYKLIGADEIIARGGLDFAQLRPVMTENTDPLAANSTLRKDEWEQIDGRVNDVLRERLTIADDLRAAGLVTQVGIGTILRLTERMNDMDAAGLSFDGDTAPTKDRATFEQDVIPVPVLSKDFTINFRQLAASRTRGEPLDVTNASQAARKVRDRLQDLIVNGWASGPGTNPTVTGKGTTIPGLTTAANRLHLTNSTDWDSSSVDIIQDVLNMLQKAYANNLFGPFNLYVPKNYWAVLQADYSDAKGDRTYIQRILAFSDVKAVRPLDALADDNVVLVQMTEDVLDLTEAQFVTTVQWEKNPWVQNFRVMFIGGPHIKSIQTDEGVTVNGIVHLS